MNYKTRHLEAVQDIPLGRDYHVPGKRFYATPVDAEYLVRHKKAIEVDTAPEPAPAPRVPVIDEKPLDTQAPAERQEAAAAPSEAIAPASAPVQAAAPAPRTPRRSTKSGAA